jgi:hypothetical protein
MSSRLEVQRFGDLSLQAFRVAKKFAGDPDVDALLQMLKEFDEEWRKNIGLPDRPQIERRTQRIP